MGKVEKIFMYLLTVLRLLVFINLGIFSLIYVIYSHFIDIYLMYNVL